jgi:hypothetical protein
MLAALLGKQQLQTHEIRRIFGCWTSAWPVGDLYYRKIELFQLSLRGVR